MAHDLLNLAELRERAVAACARALVERRSARSVVPLSPPLAQALRHWAHLATLGTPAQFSARATLSACASGGVEVQSTDASNVSLMRAFVPAPAAPHDGAAAAGAAAGAAGSKREKHGPIDAARVVDLARDGGADARSHAVRLLALRDDGGRAEWSPCALLLPTRTQVRALMLCARYKLTSPVCSAGASRERC